MRSSKFAVLEPKTLHSDETPFFISQFRTIHPRHTVTKLAIPFPQCVFQTFFSHS